MYTIKHAMPSVTAYRRLREQAGLSPKSREAAERGLPNTLFAVLVHIMHNPQLAMIAV